MDEGEPPRGTDPESIAALDRLQLGDPLADMPTSAEVAAAVCGFGPGVTAPVTNPIRSE
ncbi:hypothetical protein ACIBO9_38250 [Streptomyces prunicolor]|uniref:hypothetical protein n=1 Tax=Streptomyces prunicolor TaxID=67348 RepID=UPI0037D7825B